MSSNTSKSIVLSSTELKDLESYCKLNGLDVDQVVRGAYLQGFRIEKYGLLSHVSGKKTEPEIKEVIIEKPIIEYVEVIKEIPREVIIEKIIEVVKEIPVEKVIEKTVEVIKEIPVDRIVIQEVIKEIPVEKIVTRTEYITDESKVAELVEELERFRNLPPTIIEREVIKEVQVPYEVVKEIQVVKEVTVEVPVEVIREVLVEKKNSEDTQRLQETLNKLRQQSIDKDVKIKQLEDEINSLKSLQQQQKAVYLRGSNLDNKLYR